MSLLSMRKCMKCRNIFTVSDGLPKKCPKCGSGVIRKVNPFDLININRKK